MVTITNEIKKLIASNASRITLKFKEVAHLFPRIKPIKTSLSGE